MIQLYQLGGPFNTNFVDLVDLEACGMVQDISGETYWSSLALFVPPLCAFGRLGRCHQVVKIFTKRCDFCKALRKKKKNFALVNHHYEQENHVANESNILHAQIPTLGVLHTFKNHGVYRWVLPQYAVHIGTHLPIVPMLRFTVSVEPSPANDVEQMGQFGILFIDINRHACMIQWGHLS